MRSFIFLWKIIASDPSLVPAFHSGSGSIFNFDTAHALDSNPSSTFGFHPVSQRAVLQATENRTQTESWYAADLVHDGSFSPKSISELFTTEKTFSTANPIIVSQSSTPVEPIEIISQVAVTQSTGTPIPYSIQPTSSPSPHPTQSIEMQTAHPTMPSPVRSFETTLHPQSMVVQTDQSPIPLNSQSQTHFNQIQASPQNQIHDLQTYRLVPIIKSTPIHAIPTYETIHSTPSAPKSLKPKTTIKSTTSPRPPCTECVKPYPQIRIRMSSPRGITNIAVHPVSSANAQTTKRPKVSNRRQNRNDYDECVRTCADGKNRVCAAPAGARPADLDALRGFASICHLACHNNFKNNKYEKLLDGRCGRLRTRIRPVDSKDKIKRTELNKLQYQIVHEPGTIIEFEPIA
ncbi:hypothetical protein EVAR_65253_1 [Eumeta japonica]|uniref:Uncharacterized protein n=1 Tax=Eumeta variegata TaxID=151549 RepID=A0A4C1ZSY7_EUMVA|nr:hypothetical protein EVAR_65253_1 [Eumeta japonica]